MPSEAEYWKARRERLVGQLVHDEDELNRRLAALYEEESARLGSEIASYYQRYGENNVIEYRRLLRQLSDEDVRLLMERMDDFAEKYPQYAHLMPVRASIYRLNELEGIQASIRLQQLRIGAIEQEELEAHFSRQAARAANEAAGEMGFGSNFYRVNDRVIRETVGGAWASGKSFSESIWDNRERLASYLNDDFAKMLARGVTYAEMSKALRDRFERVSRRDSMRLIYTEGTYLLNEAQAQVHESEFDYYRLSCVNDGRACEVCRKLQEAQRASPARFDERAPGVNFPPMHPWCRCSYEVVVDDWDAWIDRYVEKRGGDKALPSGIYRDPGARPKPKEIAAAKAFIDAFGGKAEFLKPSGERGERTADCSIGGDRWEIKQPTGNRDLRVIGKNTIDHQFEEAFGQSRRLILDLTVIEGYPSVDAKAVEESAVSLLRGKWHRGFDELAVVTGSGVNRYKNTQ